MKQIKIEEVSSGSADLMVVNTARISFDKWKDALDDTDIGLMGYLASEHHITPYRHPRLALRVYTAFAKKLLPYSIDPFLRAGLVVHDCHDGTTIIKQSIFGWYQLLQRANDRYYMEGGGIEYHLHNFAPHAYTALAGRASQELIPCVWVAPVTDKDLMVTGNPWLLDVTVRIQVPIWLARQLVKHQVGFTWSEVSRRYVSTPPEYFDQELRMRPEDGIKQGSGANAPTELVPRSVIDGYEYSHQDVVELLKDWYEDSIGSGIAPETIRGYMPQNMMTTIIWTGHLPSFKHMVDLRIESHAQKEAQNFAQKFDALMQNHKYQKYWK